MSRKLVKVNEYQKIFVKKYMDYKLKNVINNSEFIDFSMLVSNVTGKDDRFINYNREKEGMIECFFHEYCCHEQRFKSIKNLLNIAIVFFLKKSCFESAFNLKSILDAVDYMIFEHDSMYEVYNILNKENNNEDYPF